jgi:hypothetical protein
VHVSAAHRSRTVRTAAASVAKEVNYALKTGKTVYELIGSKLKARLRDLNQILVVHTICFIELSVYFLKLIEKMEIFTYCFLHHSGG